MTFPQALRDHIRTSRDTVVARQVVVDLLDALEDAEERAAEMVTRDWHGLTAILDEIYPEATFPTLSSDDRHRDLGPRIISLTRHLEAAEKRARDAEAKAAGP